MKIKKIDDCLKCPDWVKCDATRNLSAQQRFNLSFSQSGVKTILKDCPLEDEMQTNGIKHVELKVVDHPDSPVGEPIKILVMEIETHDKKQHQDTVFCVFCEEACYPAPTDRGWSEVLRYDGSYAGLHFDCARKVARQADRIDEIENPPAKQEDVKKTK